MSSNQSRLDRTESQQYRNSGRSNRNYSGGGGSKATGTGSGGGATAALHLPLILIAAVLIIRLFPPTAVKQREMAKGSNGEKEKEKAKRQGLLDLIFSWSIPDVMNKTLFSDKVKRIPSSFESRSHYLKSFIDPLIE